MLYCIGDYYNYWYFWVETTGGKSGTFISLVIKKEPENLALSWYSRAKRGYETMAQHKGKSTPSLAGQVLKDYRKSHSLTQEQIAYDLRLEPRTYRAYETGEYPLNNINELRRIADLLGIEPERLGLASSLYVPRTPEQIEDIIQHAWDLIGESRVQEAQTIIDRLIQHVEIQIASENPDLLRSLARAYHTAGYVTSVGTRSYESYKAIPHYHQMEVIARIVNDDTLLNLALTYQGDMYQRLGEAKKAITYLEAARDTTPRADVAAQGNGIQLLGRAYLRVNNVDGFERTMAKSEELTHAFDPKASSTHGHYSLGTVYEEYGRSYANLGLMQKALDYLDLAQTALPQTKFWELLLTTARAIALVKGKELRAGLDLATQAANECIETGNIRFLDRIYIIDHYVEELTRDIMQLRKPVREALHRGQVTEI